MPDELSDPQRAAGVAGRRLDPDVLERPLAQQPPVGHAVERHAAGHAQVLRARRSVDRLRHSHDDLLAHHLNGSGQIHLSLCDPRLGLARRPAEQLVEGPVRHGEPGEVVEVLLVEPERAVLLQVDQLVQDQIHVLRLAVGRQAHDLVLARVDLEAGVVGEGGVEQPEGIRPMELLVQLDIVASAHAERGRGPLAHPVHGEDRRLLERGGEEGARRVGLVVLGEQDLALVVEGVADLLIHVELVLDPQRPRLQERAEPGGHDAQVGLEDALELEKRLVVEANVCQIGRLDVRLPQTIAGRVHGERRVTLLAGEALLLRGGHDLAVPQQAGGAVVVEGRDPEDVFVAFSRHFDLLTNYTVTRRLSACKRQA